MQTEKPLSPSRKRSPSPSSPSLQPLSSSMSPTSVISTSDLLSILSQSILAKLSSSPCSAVATSRRRKKVTNSNQNESISSSNEDQQLPPIHYTRAKDQLLTQLVTTHLVPIHARYTTSSTLVKDLYKLRIENAIEQLSFNILLTHPTESDELFGEIFDLLDLSVKISEMALLNFEPYNPSSYSITWALISNIMDTLTVSGSEKIFTFIENNTDRLTTGIDSRRGKGPQILRTCIPLSKRLSKGQHTVFCGRILTFLANIMPLSERSGVNLRGNFHTSNVTIYEGSPDEDVMDLDKMDDNDEKSKFYRQFWSIQRYFANPLDALKEDQFPKFKEAMDVIFARFEKLTDEQVRETSPMDSKRKDVNGAALPAAKRQAVGTSAAPSGAVPVESSHKNTNEFFPKFLTSMNLFELELRDPLFRAQFVAQFLIHSQFFLNLTTTEKPKVNMTNKALASLIGNTVVPEPTSTNETWVKDMKLRAIKLLDRMMSYYEIQKHNIMHLGTNVSITGIAHFKKLLSSLLAQETRWVNWKNLNCFGFEKEAVLDTIFNTPLDTPMRKSTYPKQLDPETSKLAPLFHFTPTTITEHLVSKADTLRKPFGSYIEELDFDYNHQEKKFDFPVEDAVVWRWFRSAFVLHQGLLARMGQSLSMERLFQLAKFGAYDGERQVLADKKSETVSSRATGKKVVKQVLKSGKIVVKEQKEIEKVEEKHFIVEEGEGKEETPEEKIDAENNEDAAEANVDEVDNTGDDNDGDAEMEEAPSEDQGTPAVVDDETVNTSEAVDPSSEVNTVETGQEENDLSNASTDDPKDSLNDDSVQTAE